MEDQPGNLLLRPLGFGEVFDRAITLYVRNFVPFSLIVLVQAVPYFIYAAVMSGLQTSNFAAMIETLRHPGSRSAPQAFLPTGTSLWVVVIAFLVMLAISPLVQNAVAIAVGKLYTGRAIDLGDCYRDAAKRYWPTIGVMLLALLVVFGALFAMVIAGFVVGGIFAALMMAWRGFAIVGIVLVALVMLAMFGIALVLVLTMYFAIYGVAIEARSVTDAFGAAFSRLFSRDQFWRSMLFGLSVAVISIGMGIIADVVVLLAALIHQPWLYPVVTTLTQLVLWAFLIVLTVVYYYDVRIRREGLDVEAGLESLLATPGA